jgi:beta-glucosidase-like glycosyl hydrolase
MSAPPQWFAARSIIARLDVVAYRRHTAYRERMLQWVRQGLGGVCLFGGTPEEVAQVVRELTAFAPFPLLVTADLEYGLPMRFAGGTAFPRAFALARAGRPEWTAAIARSIAQQARRIGIGWNFAPVCDITTNPANPVIGIRAFGQSVEEAVPHIRAWVEASQQVGVWACAKHFPGHGDVEVDSHDALPTVRADAELLWKRELEPFRAAIAAGVVGVMLGHLRVPALGIDTLPASLSPQTVQLLRGELGYDGLILTDALDMGAITSSWSTAEAAELALRAGVDLLLMPADVGEALAAVARALEAEPELLQQRRQSLLRLHRVREQIPPPDDADVASELPEELSYALRAAWAAVEVAGDKSLVPLPEHGHVVLFSCLPEERLELATLFFRLFAQHSRCPCDMAYVDARLTPEEEGRLLAQTDGATHAVVALFAPPRVAPAVWQRWYGFLQNCAALMPTVAVLLGNPFVPLPESVAATVRTYSDTEPSVVAAALLLAGVQPQWETGADAVV